MITFLIALFIVTIFISFKYFGVVAGLSVIGLWIIALFAMKQYAKYSKKRVNRLIKEDVKRNFINVNTAPWYILVELPFFQRIHAKQAVLLRRNGRYKSVDDFLNRNNVADEIKDLISKYIKV